MKPRIPSTARLSLPLAIAIAALLTLAANTAQAASPFTWTPTATGTYNWNNASSQNNWGQGTANFPNAISDVANLNINIAGDQTVNLNQAITVGTLNLGDSTTTFGKFTVSANGGSLIFDNSAAGAQLNRSSVTSALDTISAGITLNDNLTITNTGTAGKNNPLTLSGKITGTGKIIIASGVGDVALTSTLNDYNGGLQLNSGANLQTQSNGAAFGAGTITINGGTIDTGSPSGGGATITSSNANVWGGNWTLTSGGVGTAVWNNNGTVLLNANVAVSGGNINLGNVVGDGGVAKNLTLTTGNLTLSAANTYSGTTTINGGTLTLTHALALQNSTALNFVSGLTLNLRNESATVFSTPLATLSTTGTSSLTIDVNRVSAGSGNTLTLNGGLRSSQAHGNVTTINFTGGNSYLVNIPALSLVVSGSGGAGGGFTLNPTSTSVTIGSMSIPTPNKVQLFTLGGTTAGNSLGAVNWTAGSAVSLAKSGTSTWTLTGANNYTGAVTLTGGVLRITNNTALGTIAGGVTQSGASELAIDGSGGAVIVGAEALSISGGGNSNAGALRNIVGSNTYGGTVTLAAQSRINSDSGTLLLNNATSVTGAGQNLVVGGAGNVTISGAITTTTGFVSKDGAGVLILSGNNSYTGTTTISNGTLEIGGAGLLGGGGYAATITNTATLRYNSTATQTISGSISGSGGILNKDNTGTLILSGTNTYNGATTIGGGILVGVAGGSCANSDVTVNDTAGCALGTLVNDNTKQWTCNALTLAGANASLSFAFNNTPSGSTAPLVITNTFTPDAGSGITVDPANLVNGQSYPLLTCGGTAPTSWTPTPTIAGGSGTTSWTGNTLYLNVTSTPTSRQPLTWQTTTGNWDTATTLKWKDVGGNFTTYQESALIGDQVKFDDTPGGTYTVTLNTTVKPASITVNNPTRNCTISGTGNITGPTSLTKSGAALLTLSTVNSYTGGTILNGGTTGFGTNTDVHLGATSGGLTFNGGQISYSDDFVLNRDVAVNANFGLTNRIVVNGVLSGTALLSQSGSDGATFSNTGNTFSGTITVAYSMTFASLGDSSNAINIGNITDWTWSGGAKTFALRPFTSDDAGLMPITSSGSGGLVIQQPLTFSGANGARTLRLSGSYTGSGNQFAGNITDGPGAPGASVVSLSKGGDGSIWALSGTNTYTGTTTLSAAVVGNVAANGTFIFQGIQALSQFTSLNATSGASNGGKVPGTFKILDDNGGTSNGTISRSGVNLSFSGGNGQDPMTIFVGNNSSNNGGSNTANGGLGAGTTGNTLQLGNMTFTQTSASTAGLSLDVTGANGYGLKIGNVSVSIPSYTSAWNTKLNPTSASLTVTGNVQQVAGAAAGATTTLQLDGTATGNQISGNVLNSADGAARALSVTKQNTNDWALNGTGNTFSGTITVNAGTLSYASAGGANPITFSNTTGAATLSYTGSTDKNMIGAINAGTVTSGTVTLNSSGAGAINYSNSTSLGSTGALVKNLVLSGTNTGSNTLAGAWVNNGAGAATLTKNGVGKWVLSGTNTFTGGTTLNAGTLQFAKLVSQPASGAVAVKDTATLVVNLGGGVTEWTTGTSGNGTIGGLLAGLGGQAGGTVTYTGNVTLGFDTTNAGSAQTYSGVIGNLGTTLGITKLGIGTLVLDMSNTYSGVTTISGGTLALTAGALTGTTGIINNANLTIDRSTAFSQATDLNGQAITGTGSFSQAGAGTTTLTATNDYSGITTISAGTLAMGANDVLPNGSAVSIGAATLDAVTFTDTAGTLAVTSAAVINLGSTGALAFANSAAVDWTGGTLNITGTFVSGSSIRFGTTSSGLTPAQLAVISVNGSGAGTYALNASGYLVAGGGSEIAVSQGGDIATGGTKDLGTVTLGSNSSLTFTISNSGSGALNLTGSPDLVAVSGTNASDFTVTAVPTTPVTSGGGTTTFTVQFTPGAAGVRNAALSIANNDTTGSEDPFIINISGTGQTLYDEWSNRTFANGTLSDKNPTHDPDGDLHSNLQEYAFGTDPTSSSIGTGSIVWDEGGAVTNPGQPVAHDFSTGMGGVDYRAVYGRRKDYMAAGLTYTVEFSANMTDWTAGNDNLTRRTSTDPMVNPSEIEAMSVTYPLFVPVTTPVAGFEKPTFIRVVIQAP